MEFKKEIVIVKRLKNTGLDEYRWDHCAGERNDCEYALLIGDWGTRRQRTWYTQRYELLRIKILLYNSFNINLKTTV